MLPADLEARSGAPGSGPGHGRGTGTAATRDLDHLAKRVPGAIPAQRVKRQTKTRRNEAKTTQGPGGLTAGRNFCSVHSQQTPDSRLRKDRSHRLVASFELGPFEFSREPSAANEPCFRKKGANPTASEKCTRSAIPHNGANRVTFKTSLINSKWSASQRVYSPR